MINKPNDPKDPNAIPRALEQEDRQIREDNARRQSEAAGQRARESTERDRDRAAQRREADERMSRHPDPVEVSETSRSGK